MSQTFEAKNGGVGELCRVSFPLMITFLSACMMMFVDRLFISWYSLSALQAAVESGAYAWAFLFGFEDLAYITQIFVARLNGAKQFEKQGEPVWQMLWFSFVITALCFVLGTWGAPIWFAGNADKIDYFRWMLFMTPAFCFLGAVSSFFVGRGETRLITVMAIVGNLVNVVLDLLLIFGWEGICPSYGIIGAAVATGIGALVQFLVLFALMLRRRLRLMCGTGQIRLRPRLLGEMLRLGSPVSLALLLEFLGWGMFYSLMETKGESYILVASVAQSLIIPFYFFGWGIEQGATTVAGNLIGARRSEMIWNLWRSGMRLIFGFTSILFLIFVFWGDWLMFFFLERPEFGENMIKRGGEISVEVQDALHWSLYAMVAYIFLESVRLLLSGILRAAGDTTFLLLASILTIWGLMYLPTYAFLFWLNIPLRFAAYTWVFYGLWAAVVSYARLRSGAWEKSLEFASEVA